MGLSQISEKPENVKYPPVHGGIPPASLGPLVQRRGCRRMVCLFALAEADVVNKAGLSQLGVLLPQGLKQLPSDSEAAERKTDCLIFITFSAK